MNHRRISVFLLAFALLATACGSGSDASSVSASSAADTDAGSDADTSSDDAADDSSESSSGGSAVDNGATSMAASSPIGAFFSEDGGFEAALVEYNVKVEDAIIVCMAAQGFEFGRSTSNFNEVQQRQNDLTLREWRTEYGYGISTSFDSIAQQQSNNANNEIMFSLSEAERSLWVETLTGFAMGEAPDTAPALEDQGCVGEALIATGGQEAIEGIETFGEAYDEGQEALLDEREMVTAVDAWSRCMSTAGYPGFAEPDDPDVAIADEFEALMAPMSAALETMTPEEGQSLFSGESLDVSALPDLDVEALRDLQKREIETALADLDCYEAEVQDVFEPLRDAFERGLMDEYSTELNALKNIGS